MATDAALSGGTKICLGYDVVAGCDVQDLNNVFEVGSSQTAKCEYTSSQTTQYDGIGN